MRLRAAWAVVALAVTVLVPAVASTAGSQTELEKIRAEREALLDRIQEHETEANSLEDRVDALNASMVDLRKELAKLDAQIAEIQSQVRGAQARIDDTQARMDRIRDDATTQAVMLYKTGATETIDALLNSESLSELDDRIEFLGVAAEQNTDALVEFGRLRLTIEDQHRELFARQKELTEVKITQAAVLAELDSQHEQLAADLAKLEAKLSAEHRHEGNLAVAEARLEGDIQAALARQSVEVLGTSARGFIWPLNGAITSYYGPRWGRMHTGIDIDGYTGQAIVASNSGRVILASYYSGYGNAVVIDHGGGLSTLYGHLSAFDVRAGEDISRGDVIGRVGCTGSCTGDHLHFEVRVNGNPVNPLDYLP